MKQEYAATGPQQVYVEVQSGTITLRSGPDDRVEVEVTGAGADAVLVEHEDDRVAVIGRRGGGFLTRARDVTVDLLVPEGSELVTRLGSASVMAYGTLGGVDVTTGSGEVSLDRVAGPGQVKTGSGDIAVEVADGPIQLKAGSGDIRVGRLAQAGRLATGSGSIEVDRADSTVAMKSGSGDLVLHLAEADASLSAASGELKIDRMVHGKADLKNASGDIRVGVPAGTPVWTDVTTATGQVRSSLSPVGAPAAGQDYVEVRARTVSGDVHLEHLSPTTTIQTSTQEA